MILNKMKKKNTEKNLPNKGEVIIYKTSKNEVALDVRLENETVWLTQKQIAILFNTERSVITKHLRNIFVSGELKEKSNVQKMHIANSDKPVNFYGLNAIISVGYRVNSKRATEFRIWATEILRDYLIRGYVLNDKKLLDAKEKLLELKNTINFLQEKSKSNSLAGQESEILDLLSNYAKTLSILEKYDKEKLEAPKGSKSKFVLKYDNCLKIISELKENLITKKEASSLFGSERGGSFEGIIKGLYQTFGGKELYASFESKAAHLLYLIIKDHPFSDGNKRTGAFLFVYFLDKTNYLYRKSGEKKINDNALAALALLVAESNPKEKEVMVKIIMNLITE
ncbi:MAG: putative Death-on-curing family protein [Candidatus Moranbacteria bacterium GW2011_GWF2_37_11]|nr:MAG: putative Death-on-curing family protein [Candidatus Moranbacteria bacterium GW2011_GWF2_37_11]KKQ47137.1 MAG: putative Death-on-curing family protein [Candidatus Moranbacteria bacterium GW2011_GWD2_37_9]